MAARKNRRRQDKEAEQEHGSVQKRSVSQERSALGEGIGVLCVTLTIFLGLAFFSYQPDAADSNQVGRAGYVVAHVLCRAFGLTVYLFPAVLLYAMAHRFGWLRCAAPFVQSLSFVVFTLAAAAFLALWFDGRPVFRAGGWVGSFLALHLRQAGNLVGAYLLLSPVLLVSFMGITQLSLAKLGRGAGCRRQRDRAVRLVSTADALGSGCESDLRLARTGRSALDGPADGTKSPSIRTTLL